MDVQLWVDGYNVIFSDRTLASLARSDIQAAQTSLIEQVAEYASLCHYSPIIFFDNSTNDSPIAEESILGVRIVTGNKQMTADSLMEKMNFEMAKDRSIVLVTSDRLLKDMVGLRNSTSRTIASRDFSTICSELRTKTLQAKALGTPRTGLHAHLSEPVRDILDTQRRG